MLQSFKYNPEQLEKLYQYVLIELYTEDDKTSEANVIPERYASLVKDVADRLSAGLVCYINPDTLEIMDIPEEMADTMMFEEDEEDEQDEENEDKPFYADMKRIHRDWKQAITIAPPEAHDSFSFMEQFANTLPESRIRRVLMDALSGRKPFRHFNSIIHQSDEKEAWFAFRQKCLENYVAEILSGRLWDNSPGN